VAAVIALVLEASTYVGSVALVDGARLLGARTVAMRGREHEALMPAVAALLVDAGIGARGVEQVVCGAGPGAFTSLRIAGGIAKGLALSLAVPLRGLSSLALLAAARPLPAGRYLAVLDAMRAECYVQRFAIAGDGAVAEEGAMALVPAGEVPRTAGAAGAVAIGPGQGGEWRIDPHAAGAVRLTNMIARSDAADLASWEPTYGRRAEAQVKWEAEHGRPLAAT
jgi:tRNA threonylcarbamoyladenosine biosynthesis protein TsaB